MEDFFSFVVVVIGVVAAIVNAANKNKKKQASKMPYAGADLSSASPKPAAVPPKAEQVSMSSMLPPREGPQQAVQPTVHPHLEPDCETHDVPGSLNVTSMEGKDPCHEEQLTIDRTPETLNDAPGGMTFDWSGNAMVKAFVMQEVLTRPSQRRAR